MPEENKPKLYKPKDIRAGWVATIYFVFLIIFCFNVIFRSYWHIPLEKYIPASLVCVAGIFWFSLMIYYPYAYCIYVETTEDKITGKNVYKMKKNVLKFNEIKEIWLTKRIIIIHLKDIHGNKFGMAFREEFIPVLKELLEKSVNCTRIDFNYDYIMKKGLSQRLPEIKPLLDKRLAEIKEKEQSS